MADPFRTKLIELIEGESSIWDVTSSDYHYPGRKKDAWDRVVKALNENGHRCSLRDAQTTWRYIKDLRRKKKRAVTGSAASKKWIYTDMLTFMDKVDCVGTTVSNLDCNGNFKLSEQPVGYSEEYDFDIEDRPVEGNNCESAMVLSTMVKDRATKKDEALQLIREATEAVKQKLENSKDSVTKYLHFALYLAKELEEMPTELAATKMHQIITILIHNATVTVPLEDTSRQFPEGLTIVVKN